jgi:hypothetical protein
LYRDKALAGDRVNIPDYAYTGEQCDVPEVRRAVLGEYRLFRRKCLTYLRGDADTSVMNLETVRSQAYFRMSSMHGAGQPA